MLIPAFTGRIDVDAFGGAAGVQEALERRVGEMPAFVHVNHGTEAERGESLVRLSRGEPRFRETLNVLTNSGYYVYMAQAGETRLVKEERLRGLWQKVVDGTFLLTDSGVVYSYTPPSIGDLRRLVIVFSPMAANPFEVSLNRYFWPSYSSLGAIFLQGLVYYE